MTTIEKHFAEILKELNSNRDASLDMLLRSVHSLIDVLPIAAALRPVQDHYLLQGLLFAQAEIQFFQRLRKQSEQKRVLAEYSMRQCELQEQLQAFQKGEPPTLNRVFFESGSTIAHLIGMFANALSKAQRKRSAVDGGDPEPLQSTIVTNNLTAVTALAGLVANLEPVQGRLSMKYFGFFPFSEDDQNPNWRQEGKRFNLLAEDIETCDSVFATCSNFSFLAGPIVGGRDNCLTKRSMYSGAARWDDHLKRQFYLVFHFQKLVPLFNSGPRKFESPQQSCGCVFSPPSKDLGDAITRWRFAQDQDDPVNSNEFDGSWHDRFRELSAKDRRSDNIIQFPVEKFEEATSQNRVRVPHELSQPWLEWLKYSIGLNILISLPEENPGEAFECIRNEVFRNNGVLDRTDLGISYAIRNDDSAVSDSVVHLEVQR